MFGSCCGKIRGLEGLIETTFAGKTSFPPSHQTFQTTIKESETDSVFSDRCLLFIMPG